MGFEESKNIPCVRCVQNLCTIFRKIEFKNSPRIKNEFADALSIITSMIKHPDTDYINPLDIELKEHQVHCSHVESEPDGLPWYFDIKRYSESGTYPENATSNQKKWIRYTCWSLRNIYEWAYIGKKGSSSRLFLDDYGE
ncbi:uncharacterized protein [Solanum lycopersicum]|uniref:uncharacterized protein n=1 Tax=Solanum lycopersicum TaxID=4081 RepID=UPI00374A6DF2